jgi:hypothetical protein
VGNGGLSGFRQPRSGPETASFIEMVNHVFSLGFTHLGIKQGSMASFRELFTTLATA